MGSKTNLAEQRGLIAVGLAALVVVGLLVWGVGQQLYRLSELRAAEAELLPLLEHEQERNAQLLQKLAHVSSPTYAEEWARVHAGMVRPGEVRAVVTLPEETPAPLPSADEASPPSPSFWEELWQQLAGE